MAAMAEDHRHTLHELENRRKAPEYDLNSIHRNLESLGDPLEAVLKIKAARDKRMQADEKRQEANRRLQEQLARKHEEQAARDREEAEAREQDTNPPAAAPEEPGEPEVAEALCLVPPQPLPPVDLSPLGLPPSLSPPEAMSLLQQLTLSRQLFDYVGVGAAGEGGDAASPVLRVLFNVVSYGENPYNSYQQLVRYYSEVDPADLGWVPQLPDFLGVLTTLGYQPPKGHGGGGGGRKRSTGEGAEAAGSGGGAGGGGGLGAGLANLESLLRLLADLTRLQQQGRLDMGFGSQGQAPCKALITFLLRSMLDPVLAPPLHADACAALEGLLAPWDEPAWRRICDDAAVVAAELGPSHRAAYRVIAGAQGLSDRMRVWQQCAAMQLLRKALPQGMAGGSGAGGSHRGRVGVDITQVSALLGPASAASVKSLMDGLTRGSSSRGERGGGGGGAAAASGVDYWRLLTVLQTAHLVVWNTANVAEAGEVDDTVRWISSYFKAVEQRLRGQQATVMRIKVFLADVQTHYELLAGMGE